MLEGFLVIRNNIFLLQNNADLSSTLIQNGKKRTSLDIFSFLFFSSKLFISSCNFKISFSFLYLFSSFLNLISLKIYCSKCSRYESIFI